MHGPDGIAFATPLCNNMRTLLKPEVTVGLSTGTL